MNIAFMGLKPDVNIVTEYIKDTGNKFTDLVTLEEVEKFALWVIAKHIPIPDESPSLSLSAEQEAREYAEEMMKQYKWGKKIIPLYDLFKQTYLAGKASGGGVYTEEQMLAAIKYGFEYHRDAMNDDVDVPLGNKRQWLLSLKPLPTTKVK